MKSVWSFTRSAGTQLNSVNARLTSVAQCERSSTRMSVYGTHDAPPDSVISVIEGACPDDILSVRFVTMGAAVEPSGLFSALCAKGKSDVGIE